MKKLIIICALLKIISACAPSEIILENRTDCPCMVYVNFSALTPEVKRADLWFWGEDGKYEFYHRYEVPFPDDLYVPVRKGSTTACLWGNMESTIADDTNRKLKFAREAELLWAWQETFDTKRDTATVTPIVARRGCPVNVTIVSYKYAVENISVSISTKTSGYSYSGIPEQGVFRYPLTHLPDEEQSAFEKYFRGIIPYQPFTGGIDIELNFIYDGFQRNSHFDLGRYLTLQQIDLAQAEAVNVVIEINEITGTDISFNQEIAIHNYSIVL